MTTIGESKKEIETRLRGLLEESEPVIAVGTAEELRELKPEIGSGGGWTFLVISRERLFFARTWPPGRPHQEILLDSVTRWSDGSQYNAYAVVLEHPPMKKRARVAAHRFLWFKWGHAYAEVSRTTTILRFSRRETAAALALRQQLEARDIARETLEFKEVTREERTRGGILHLIAEDRSKGD